MKLSSLPKTILCLLSLLCIFGCAEEKKPIDYPKTDLAQAALIPRPLQVEATHSAFGLDRSTVIVTEPSADFRRIGKFLADDIKKMTDLMVPVNPATSVGIERVIVIGDIDNQENDTPESYQVHITNDSLIIGANTAAGAFRGMQTVRQLIPQRSNDTLAEAPMWLIPTGTINDSPNFSYRGAMLDVARHFFRIDEVKRYIDQLAYYKFNALHLHLTDDQGWRIEIKSWPKLTTVGAQSEVGGGHGGFYTQEEFKGLVAYANERFIDIIPEVDMPGHTNAANLSYPQFHARGKAETPRIRTDMKVGYSSFDAQKDTVYAFLDDVIREISAISPGPFFHIGGDESHVTPKSDYITFVEKVEGIVQKHGKRAIGWNEIAQASIDSSTVGQLWNEPKSALKAAQKGCNIILSPAKKIYLDMKYDSLSKHGLTWAAMIPVDDAYNWNPETYVEGLSKDHIMGIEAPLWSETISNSSELEYLAFPRVIGYSELGWTPESLRDWNDYERRLIGQLPYLQRNAINFYRSPKVQWK